MTEYKCKVYVIEPQIGWHGFSLVAAIDANYANDIIRKAAGESRYYWVIRMCESMMPLIMYILILLDLCMKGFLKTMNIAELIKLVEKTDWNKYHKEDILDLVKEHPDLLDMTPVQLRTRARDLDWDADGYMNKVNSLENEASLTRDLIEIMYGE